MLKWRYLTIYNENKYILKYLILNNMCLYYAII